VAVANGVVRMCGFTEDASVIIQRANEESCVCVALGFQEARVDTWMIG
jgi:hypothetical protein